MCATGSELRAALERHQQEVWRDDDGKGVLVGTLCAECGRTWPCDAALALAEIERLEAALEDATPVVDATVLAGPAIHYYQHPTRKVGGKGCHCGEVGAIVLDRIARIPRAALEETKP